MVRSETQIGKKDIIEKAKIFYEKCIGCGKCLIVCEPKAIPESYIGYISLFAKIDRDLCTGCGKCLEVCKYNAIILTLI